MKKIVIFCLLLQELVLQFILPSTRIWIGDLDVHFAGVYDGTYVAVGSVWSEPSKGNPLRSNLESIYCEVWANGDIFADILNGYTYIADDGLQYNESVFLTISADGTMTVTLN